MRLVSLLIDSIRLKLTPIWSRIRKWTNKQSLQNQAEVKIRDKFIKSLGIRPRNKNDYCAVGFWLVSRRLVLVLVLLTGVLSILYIALMLPEGILGGRGGNTYYYNSIPLKFKKGTVTILGKSGYTAYAGQVEKGAVQGKGILYDVRGDVVYEGEFVQNKFEGTGKLNGSGGILEYEGEFKDGHFSGQGTAYHENGTPEYQGEFQNGERVGDGELYNERGQLVYTGRFLRDQIVYEEFPGKSTKEAGSMYTGKRKVYAAESTVCVAMEEISAVYCGRLESAALSEEWNISGVYVLKNTFQSGGKECSTIEELKEQLGKAEYEGTTQVNLADAVALNQLAEIKDSFGTYVEMQTEAEFEDVTEVTAFDDSYTVYVTSFLDDNFRYLFFAPEKSSEFYFYSIENTAS